jgi:uncharacterized protein YaiL (DUF2058 family)
MSLRDQLLKAGLVTEEQVKKTEAQAKKSKHKQNKNRTLAAEEAVRKAEERRQQEAEQAQKRERDRQLNEQREAVKRRRENAARIKQLIAGKRVNDANAEIPYNFQAGRAVRKVRVTEKQKTQLALGRLGIVRNPYDEFDFPILPREAAEKLGEIDQALILLLYPLTNKLDEEDEWGDW